MDDLQNVPVPKSPNLNFNDSQGASLWDEFDIKEEFYNKEGIKFKKELQYNFSILVTLLLKK
jgi:hypothetical protein